MWKAYTRETPGRRGWALGVCAIGFIAAVCMAQYAVQHHATHLISLNAESLNDLPDMPFDINLPDDYDWLVNVGPVRPKRDRLLAGAITFNGTSATYGTCEVWIGWSYSVFDRELKDLSDKMTNIHSDDVKEIRFGPARGFMSHVSLGPMKSQNTGIVKFDNDLNIVIRCTVTGRAKSERMFRSLCRSIRPKDEGEAEMDNDVD